MRDRFLWIGSLMYAVLFVALGLHKYVVHRNLVDFGVFEQTAASAFGCFCNTVEGSHWAFHFSPILYVVGAVVAIARSPITLVALQSIACGLVAPPIAALVAKYGNQKAARMAALIVWFYPPLAGLAFGDFHENVFAPAAIAWMLWAFDAGTWRLTVLFALIALAVKEDQSVFLLIAGLLGAWRLRGTAMGRASMAIAALSVVVLLLFYFGIQPRAAAHAIWMPLRFYDWSAADVRSLFPGGLLQRAGFLVLALLPLLFLPFRSRMIWLAAAPLAEVLLSRMPTAFTMGTHYAGAWIGYVLVAFAFAVRDIALPNIYRLLVASIALCLVEFLVADPLHPGLNLRPHESRDVALDRFLATLPPDIGVATQEEAYAHLALKDPHAGLLPEVATIAVHACFILIDRDFPDSPRLQEYGERLSQLVQAKRYTIARSSGAILLYRSPQCSR